MNQRLIGIWVLAAVTLCYCINSPATPGSRLQKENSALPKDETAGRKNAEIGFSSTINPRNQKSREDPE